ncbi:winged helix-turn-helix domain-containing protein [Streptomyces sp. NPDC056405]|uniref:helix-turn-helix domain-containing protein n=1 Tax=Streptomyces sp. NPDC056405 TaxID=3345811 RepID=UPI0035D6F494
MSARVKTLIGRLIHVSYTVEGTWRLLKRQGWSWQQPARRTIECTRTGHLNLPSSGDQKTGFDLFLSFTAPVLTAKAKGHKPLALTPSQLEGPVNPARLERSSGVSPAAEPQAVLNGAALDGSGSRNASLG